MPPQASTSASATFCTQLPTAPRAICSLAMTGDLCVLACARSLTPVGASSAAMVSRFALEGVQVDDQGGRVDFFFAHAGDGGRDLQHRLMSFTTADSVAGWLASGNPGSSVVKEYVGIFK